MSKGIDFEIKMLNFLKFLFEELGFRVIEALQQQSGTQNGFDIKIGFLDDSSKIRKFYFECKDYKSKLSWNSIMLKIHEVNASNYLPDGYIAISPHVNFTNNSINNLEGLSKAVNFPIRYWTPQSGIREYFSLDATLFTSIYGENGQADEAERQRIRIKLRNVILDILREKDELGAKGPDRVLPKDLTLKIPKIHKGDIIGRGKELHDLHELLFKDKCAVAVTGLGGIGKTTLLRGYTYIYYQEYRHVVWISQMTGNIAVDITNVEGLAENLAINKENKKEESLFHEILRKLKAISVGPNLLIIDNADKTLTELKDFLPTQPDWHLLVTSREQINGFYLKELDFLSLEQAIILFKKYCFQLFSEEEITNLIKAVDYHTLTIEILAKTAQYRRLTIKTLKQSIKEDLKSNVYVEHKGERINKIRGYLSSIFNLSGLSEEEIWLMQQFTCLPAEFHTYLVLLELIDPDHSRVSIVAETLNDLVEKGWLLFNKDTDAYKMHLIVKEVVVRQLLPALEAIEAVMDIGQLSVDLFTEKSPYKSLSARPISKSTDKAIVKEIFGRQFYGDATIPYPDDSLWVIYDNMRTDDIFGAYMICQEENVLFLLEVLPIIQADLPFGYKFSDRQVGIHCFTKSEDKAICLLSFRSCIKSIFKSPQVAKIVTSFRNHYGTLPEVGLFQRSGFVLASSSRKTHLVYECTRRTFIAEIASQA